MVYLLISIKDRAVEAYQPIGTVRAEGEALRVFKDLIANPQSQQHNHADDYDLYLVGFFDDQTGEVYATHKESQDPLPRKLADGKTMKEMLTAERMDRHASR